MSFSRWLGPLRPKHQKTRSASTTNLTTDETEYEDTEQPSPTASSLTVANNPRAPKRPSFFSSLSKLSHRSQEGKFNKAIKITWPIFKGVLRTVKEASDAIPPLKIALTGLLEVLEQCEMTADAQDDLSHISHKLKALEVIVKRHRHSRTPKHVEERLQGLADWIGSVMTSIKAQTSRSSFNRVFTATEDSKNVVELLGTLTWAIDLFALDTTLEAEGQLDKIDKKLDNLEDQGLLVQLRHVQAANFTSQRGELCLLGTRCSVIAAIMSWCTNPEGPRVYWLSGMAGTGKSAIARTVCDNLLKATSTRLLGGSFFCSRRATAEEQDIRRIVPTLAWQLSQLNKRYRKKLVERLKQDLDVVGATVEKQLKELIIEPCQDPEIRFPKPFIIVIDALDEGSRADDTAQLLKAILEQTAEADVPLKFLVTSRPESHIRSQFLEPSHAGDHTTFYLQNIEESFVQADIRLYVKNRLEKIKKDPKHQLPAEWPSKEEAERLVVRADKLFIYAFTACNYIQRDPYDGLTKVIEAAGRDDRPLAEKMDEMYVLILDEATNSSNVPSHIILTIRKCLTVLIYAREIFSLSALAALIDIGIGRLQNAIDQLHSLILVPLSNEGEVTTLHASLGDYLVDKDRSGRHFIPKDEAHLMLLQRCFQILATNLRFNVAQANTSFLSNEDQGLSLPQHFLYAAGRWSDHIIQDGSLEQSVAIVTWIEETLVPKFLYWLEAVSLAKRTDVIPDMLQTLLSFVKARLDLIRFIDDGIYFAYESKDAISWSLPHIYLSALAFCRDRSMIKEKFRSLYKGIGEMNYVGMNRLKAWELCLVKHTGNVNSVAFSPNGNCIISGSSDGTVQIWDAHTGQPAIPPLQGHTSAVSSVAYSPDGNCIVSGSYDNTVRVWDANTCQPAMPPLQGHTSSVNSVAYSPDGNRIVSGSNDNTVQVWDAHTGQPAMPPLQGHTDWVNSVVYSPDGNRIVSGSYDNTVRVWDAHTGQPAIPPLQGHTSAVSSVAYSPDGNCIVSGSYDNTVRVWDAHTGQPAIPPLQGHTSEVSSVAYSPNGNRIVSGSNDNTVRVWDAHTGQPVMPPLQGHTGSIYSVAYSAIGNCIVSGSSDNTVRVWDANTSQPAIPPLQGHTSAVSSVAYSPDGNRIVSGSYDNTVRVWDAYTGQPAMPPLQGHTSYVNSVAYSPDGNHIVSGSYDNIVRVWDAHTGQSAMPPLQGHTSEVSSVAYSPDGNRIISGSYDNTVRVWDAHTGQPAIPPLQGHTSEVSSVAYSPDGNHVVSGSYDNTVRVWDAHTGQPAMPPLKGHTSEVSSMAYSPNVNRIVSGSWDNMVRVWDAHTGQSAMPPLQGHTNEFSSMAYSPNGNRIVSGSYDNIVQVLDAYASHPAISFSTNPVNYTNSSPSLVALTYSLPQQLHYFAPFKLSKVPSFNPSPTFLDLRDLFSFDIDNSWIKGPNGELFVWIPQDIQSSLYMPRTILVINQTRLHLDLSNFAYGDDWESCNQVLPTDELECSQELERIKP